MVGLHWKNFRVYNLKDLFSDKMESLNNFTIKTIFSLRLILN